MNSIRIAHTEAFHVALIVALLVAFSISDVSSTTSNVTCNNPVSLKQCGTIVVTANAGGSAGIGSIVYPTAFAITPIVHTFTIPSVNQLSFSFQFLDTVTIVSPNTGTITWAAMPAAETEFLGLAINRISINLRQVSTVQIFADVQSAGATGSILKLQYFNTTSTTWIDLCGASTDTPNVAIDVVGSNIGSVCGPVASLKSASGPNITIRIAGKNGNGIASPQFGNIGIIVSFQMSVTPYTTLFAVTQIGFTVIIQFGIILSVSTTITVQWDAEL